MKKLLIVLLLSPILFSCLTTDNFLDEVVDTAVEETVVAVIEDTPVEAAEPVEPEVSAVPAAPAKVIPTQQQVVDAVKAYDLEGLTQLLADVDDVKTIVGDDVLLCHMAEEAMGMVGQKNELLALLVEKKAYILQVDKDEKSMNRYAHAMEMGGTERTDYMDEVIGDKFQQRIEALRSDDLETIISMTEYFPVNAYLLKSAVEEKAARVTSWLIDQGIPVDGIDARKGDSLLHLACDGKPYNHLFDDRLDLVNALLDSGADINLENKKGDTPIGTLFMVAAGKNGSRNLLAKVLLDAGADVNTVTSKNMSLLNHATMLRNDELINLLLDEGVVLDEKSLNDMNLSIDTMLAFIDAGADASYFADNLQGITDLDVRHQFVIKLIESGAEVSDFDLRYVYKHFDTLAYLVENGADINAGMVMSSVLIDYSGMDIIEYLVENGADVTKKFYSDKTALHFAVQNKRNEAVIYLMEHGAELNAVDANGKTPLDYCKSGNVELMSILVDGGAKKASEL